MSEEHVDYKEKLGDDLAEFLADPNQEKFSLQEHWKHIRRNLMDSPYLDGFMADSRHEVEELPTFAQDSAFCVRSDVHRFPLDRFDYGVYEKHKVSDAILRPLCKSYGTGLDENVLRTIKQSSELTRMLELVHEEDLNRDHITRCLHDAVDLLSPRFLSNLGVVMSRKFHRMISCCLDSVHSPFNGFVMWNLDPNMGRNEAFLVGDFDNLHCFDVPKNLILKKEPSNFGAAAVDVRMTGLHSIVLSDTLKKKLEDYSASMVLAGFATAR